ncbi:hypothetical protein [Acinetobacter sp. YH12153]|uniref:hypothetical protein n=1 Tax=Acinetobacter sp. YH12153 TaxID=2601133 RepID=UPI0015D3B222|nr:hypothetical protein [Acinetobacter sp. YH12153]
MKSIYEVRLENLKHVLKFIKRKDLCVLIDIDYNLLNQYLGANAKKKIGPKIAAKINAGLNFPENWMDAPHTLNQVKLALNQQIDDSAPDLNITDILTIKAQRNGAPKIDFEVEYTLDDVFRKYSKIRHAQYLLNNSRLFLIEGGSTKSVYRNGQLIGCSKNTILKPGADVVVVLENGEVMFSEFLYERFEYLNFMNVLRERASFSKQEIQYIAPIDFVMMPN